MRRRRSALFLEPGEVQALAEAVRTAADGVGAHPRRGLFVATAAALEALVDGDGVMVVPAPRAVARWAARSHARRGSGGQSPGDEPTAD